MQYTHIVCILCQKKIFYIHVRLPMDLEYTPDSS